MKRAFLLGLVVASSHLFAEVSLSLAGELVDTEQFMSAAIGGYTIEKAGGTVPHGPNVEGDISVESGEAVITLPYCTDSFCDPGFNFFPLAETQVYKALVGRAHTIYSLVVTSAGTTKRYEWEDNDGKISFRNFQYDVGGGNPITLEHQIVKK